MDIQIFSFISLLLHVLTKASNRNWYFTVRARQCLFFQLFRSGFPRHRTFLGLYLHKNWRVTGSQTLMPAFRLNFIASLPTGRTLPKVALVRFALFMVAFRWQSAKTEPINCLWPFSFFCIIQAKFRALRRLCSLFPTTRHGDFGGATATRYSVGEIAGVTGPTVAKWGALVVAAVQSSPAWFLTRRTVAITTLKTRNKRY